MEKMPTSNGNHSGEQKSSDYLILSTNEFFQDQINEVARAEIRTWIQTMALEPSYFTNLLVFNLIQAAQRGVDVRVVHDAYSDYVTDNSFNSLSLLLQEKVRQKKRTLQDQRSTMVELMRRSYPVVKTNISSKVIAATPMAAIMGRDHKKISIVDESAYIGGVNLTSLDERRLDLMLKTSNASIVFALKQVYIRSFYEMLAQDMEIKCDEFNLLLIDSGFRGQSTIMNCVYKYVQREQEKIVVLSPYLPSGKFRRLLNNAVISGVEVEVYTTGYNQTGLAPKASQFIHNLGQSKPKFKIMRYQGIVHAKALIFGQHSAMIGSHNFDELFVQFGTEELALLTRQGEIIDQLQQYVANMRQFCV